MVRQASLGGVRREAAERGMAWYGRRSTTRLMDDKVKRFLDRKVTGSRTARMELRLHEEQRAAYDEAASIEGDIDASAWARRVLDAAARKTLKSQ
jgi:hypothetical protein